MKKLFFTLLISTLLPNLSFAIDTAVKGFIALDAFNYKRIQRMQDSINIGIGVLDLKIFAEQEDMSAVIKLNIDGNLSVQNNLFEEAYANYRGFKNWKITLGKGVVKFQNLHWGVVANTYQDGGSVLDSENSWRKISNKALVSFAYGHRGIGFTNTFTVWGDSLEIQYDERGNPRYTASGAGTSVGSPKTITAYETKSTPSFTSQKQLGLANKFELYKTEEWTLTNGLVYYKNKLQDKASYAIDFGAVYDGPVWQYWIDAIYGFTSKSPYEAYTTFRKNEYFLQTGLQYTITEKWSVLTNLEYLHAKDQAHTYTPFSVDGVFYAADTKIDKSGQTVVSSSYKVELGGQYKLSKSSFVTSGVLYEKKIAAKNGVKNLTFIKGMNNANAEAFQLLSSISFWF
jgi:hypothetical protein